MNIAIIDLGTNTFNLIVFDSQNLNILHNSKVSVRLGKGGITKATLAPDAWQRGKAALAEHKNTAAQWQVSSIYCFATSALRSADNGVDFVREVERDLGLIIHIIDGQKEAEFICEGVRRAGLLQQEKVMIMDIGGGSTEFIIADANEIYFKNSYLLGVTRLIDQLQPQDPITKSDVEALNLLYHNTLAEVLEAAKLHQIDHLIGSSGSFDTLADIQNHRNGKGGVLPGNGFQFDLEDLEVLGKELLAKTTEERLKIAGMIPMRADMIHLSFLQIDYLKKHLPIHKITLSNYALKEGVMTEITINPKKWHAYYL